MFLIINISERTVFVIFFFENLTLKYLIYYDDKLCTCVLYQHTLRGHPVSQMFPFSPVYPFGHENTIKKWCAFLYKYYEIIDISAI